MTEEVKKEISLQKQMFHCIYLNGGTATTDDILKLTGFSRGCIYGCAKRLIYLNLIKKNTSYRPPYPGYHCKNRIVTYTINKKNTYGPIIIKQMEEFDANKNLSSGVE